MGIRSEDPRQTPGWKKQDWNYDAPENGKAVEGYLAALPLWITIHHSHGSRPCRAVVSRGALVCPMCACELPTKQRGYVAYYTRDYLHRFFLIPDTLRLAVSELKPGAQIEISRAKPVYSPAIPREKMFRPIAVPKSLPTADEVNLLPSLLRMWEDVALQRWHESESDPAPSDTPVSPPPPADVPAAIAERMAGSARPTADQIEAKLDEVIGNLAHKGRALKRGRPSVNGTHPPPTDT